MRVAGFHRLLVDRRGRFTGVELDVEGAAFAELTEDERRQLQETIDGVARELRATGYVGPFGIDCWRHRRSDGTIAFHPLGEINARMTFGLVARALVDRVRDPLGLAPGARARIVFGRGKARSGRRVSLLLPDDADVAVELEILKPI